MSPAIGEFAVQEAYRLKQENERLRAALGGLLYAVSESRVSSPTLAELDAAKIAARNAIAKPTSHVQLEKQLNEFWVNIYPDGRDRAYQACDSKASCDQCAGGDRLACVRVPYADGQFDDVVSASGQTKEYCPRCDMVVRTTEDGEACSNCLLVL